MLPTKLLTVLAVAVLTGCASTQETRSTPIVETFISAKPSQELTICIDKNIDGAILNSLRTNVKSFGGEKFEIVVRNGDLLWAVVGISPTAAGASAEIRLGGVATITPLTSVRRLTKDCG